MKVIQWVPRRWWIVQGRQGAQDDPPWTPIYGPRSTKEQADAILAAIRAGELPNPLSWRCPGCSSSTAREENEPHEYGPQCASCLRRMVPAVRPSVLREAIEREREL